MSVKLGMSALVISAFIVVLIPVELFLAKMLADKQKFILVSAFKLRFIYR